MSVYLDNAAATKVIPEALSAATAAMTEAFGNPSSVHKAGQEASALLCRARSDLAGILGVTPAELFFTSGGTESINTALRGAALKNKHLGAHIVSSEIEHDATLNTLKFLKEAGFEVTLVKPRRDGSVALDDIKAAIRPDTILMTLMGVCNETGACLPYDAAADLLHKVSPKALFHLDAVQLFCKMPMTLKNVDLCSFSAHKIGGIKGCGALYIKKGLTLRPLLYGGGQERSMRSGTEALPLICAFAAAAKARSEKLTETLEHFAALKSALLENLTIPYELNSPEVSSAHIVNISPCKLRSEVLIRMLSDMGFYVSGGSACARGKKSHVLQSMKLSPANIDAALRISFCPENTKDEVIALCRALSQII